MYFIHFLSKYYFAAENISISDKNKIEGYEFTGKIGSEGGHPLLQEWVILAAVTSERPWSGETVKALSDDGPEFDPNCYLCPGVTRASGVKILIIKDPGLLQTILHLFRLMHLMYSTTVSFKGTSCSWDMQGDLLYPTA